MRVEEHRGNRPCPSLAHMQRVQAGSRPHPGRKEDRASRRPKESLLTGPAVASVVRKDLRRSGKRSVLKRYPPALSVSTGFPRKAPP
jgi:hypothetical protein